MGHQEIGDYIYRKQYIENKHYCIFKTNYDSIILDLKTVGYNVKLLQELPKEVLVDDYYEFTILKNYKRIIHYYLVYW